VSAHLSWLEAAVIGAMQGVAELFPVSSLGHSILLPAVIGGSWARDLDVSAPGSPYLAFIVGLHVATAIAMIVYFWRDWVRILRGLGTSVRDRRVETADQRLAWLLVLATIPVGLAGLVLDHVFRTLLAKPVPTALFLVINGVLLLAVEGLTRRRSVAGAHAGPDPAALEAPTVRLDAPTEVLRGGGGVGVAPVRTAEELSDARVAKLPLLTAVLIGVAQILALLPGISRSGATIGAGLLAKLSHEDAARFAFLLATPIIGAAALLKLPDLFGSAGNGVRGPALVGALCSGVTAFLAVKFLMRYFETRTLTPFAIYCLCAGTACAIYFAL
jgi:undecaprenyl-diphosphatase